MYIKRDTTKEYMIHYFSQVFGRELTGSELKRIGRMVDEFDEEEYYESDKTSILAEQILDTFMMNPPHFDIL